MNGGVVGNGRWWLRSCVVERAGVRQPTQAEYSLGLQAVWPTICLLTLCYYQEVQWCTVQCRSLRLGPTARYGHLPPTRSWGILTGKQGRFQKGAVLGSILHEEWSTNDIYYYPLGTYYATE